MEPLRSSVGQTDEDPILHDLTFLTDTLAQQGAAAVSCDVALDVVLHDIAENARLETRATGAAIALWRSDEMICRAATGPNAPDLGIPLESQSGITGACIQTKQPQQCVDTDDDPRVDALACRHLGVRSAIVVPVMRGGTLEGIFEVFSEQPRAFCETDVAMLVGFSSRVAQALEAHRSKLRTINSATAKTRDEGADMIAAAPDGLGVATPAIMPQSPSDDTVTAVLGVLVVFAALLLGVLIGWRVGWQRAVLKTAAGSARTAAVAQSEMGNENPKTAANSHSPETAPPGGISTRSRPQVTKVTEVPAGALIVYQNGKVIYRLQDSAAGPRGSGPATAADTAMATSVASAGGNEVLQLSEEAAEQRLIHRVTPIYPAGARSRGTQGDVVLGLIISAQGSVERLGLLQGDPDLAGAAMSAVQQWRYEPYMLGNRAVPVQTRVTIHFLAPTE